MKIKKNNTNIFVSMAVGVVFCIGLLIGFSSGGDAKAEIQPTVNQGSLNVNLTFSEVKELLGMVGEIVAQKDEQKFGALTGPDIYSYLTVNGLLTAANGFTMSNGDLNVSSGVSAMIGETATSTLVEDIMTFTRTSATDYNTDGIGSGLLFKAYDSNGSATSTGRISFVMDDVTSGSDETSFIIEQLLDDGIALSNVFEIDSGNIIVNTDDFYYDRANSRIGINDATPSYSLDVTGTTQFTGASIFGSSITATSGSSAFATTTTESLTTGGENCTLTDANGGTYTLTQEEMARCSMFEFAAGGAGQEVIALTFPATSTMTTLIPNAGDCRTWLYDSSALAAATTTTMTAGTGHNVIAYTTDDDVIDGAEFAQIQMCRAQDTDVNTIVTELLNAD